MPKPWADVGETVETLPLYGTVDEVQATPEGAPARPQCLSECAAQGKQRFRGRASCGPVALFDGAILPIHGVIAAREDRPQGTPVNALLTVACEMSLLFCQC
jgi:hypothetical protein